MAVAVITIGLTGCGVAYLSPVMPPMGSVITTIKAPLTTDFHGTDVGGATIKTSKKETYYVFIPFPFTVDLAWGEADILEIARRLDVNALRFQLVSVVDEKIKNETNKLFQRDVVGYHSYSVSKDLRLKKNDLIALRMEIKKAKQWSKETGIQLQAEVVFDDKEPVKNCQFVKSSFVVNPYGDILPCPMLTNYSIGNILGKGMEDLWGNEKHTLFLNSLNQAGQLPVCSECCVEKLSVF